MQIDSVSAAGRIIKALQENCIEPCIVCAYGLECPFSEKEYSCLAGVVRFLEEQE